MGITSNPNMNMRLLSTGENSDALTGISYPSGLQLLYTPTFKGGGQTSLVGPSPQWLYAGNQYNASGVSVGEFPAVQGQKGVWVGPTYENLFTVAIPQNEIIALSNATAYTIFLTGTGSATITGATQGLYDTVDDTAPVTFTTTAGENVTFAITGQVLTWQLVESAYVFPYVPPGTTVEAASGSKANNGLSFIMNKAIVDSYNSVITENLVRQSFNYTTSPWWSLFNTTQIDNTTYKTLWQTLPNPTNQTLIEQAIPNTAGKYLKYRVRCRVNADCIKDSLKMVLKVYDDDDDTEITNLAFNNLGQVGNVRKGEWVSLESNTVRKSVGDTLIRLCNVDDIVSTALTPLIDIEYISVYEPINTLWNIGDSLSFTAVAMDYVNPLEVDPQYSSITKNYVQVYAEKYGLDHWDGSQWGTIMQLWNGSSYPIRDTIKAGMDDLTGQDRQQTFFTMQGGGADIEFGVTNPITTMQTGMGLAITKVKEWTDYILLCHVVINPAFEDQGKDVWVQEFNDWLDLTYGDDPNIIIMPINDVLSTSYAVPYPDFQEAPDVADRIHISESGNVKLANLMDSLITPPWGRVFTNVVTTTSQITTAPVAQPMTTAALVTTGVSATELNAIADVTPVFVASVANVVPDPLDAESILYYKGSDIGFPIISGTTDGGEIAGVVSSWDRDEEVLMVCQVSADGTKYKAGYSTDMSTITWSVIRNYSGDYDPLSRLRLAFNCHHPLWIKQVQVWNKEVTDDEIIGVVDAYTN